MSTTQSSNGATIRAAQVQHNRIFAAYVLLLVLTVLCTYLVWSSGSKVQDAIQADANARIAEAQAATATLTNQLNAEVGKVAGLQKDASDAKAAQQKVEIELSKQQERAARAEATLFELQKRNLPRMLSIASLEFLKGKAVATAEIMYKRDDSEASLFAEWIFGWLGSNGWRVSKRVPIPQNIPADKTLELLGAEPLGVTIAIKAIPDNSKRDDPYNILMEALSKSLGQVSGARDPNLPDNVLRIIVMQK